jgi:hypothetical protein
LKKFEATLKRPEGVGTWTYLDIPFSIVDAFGAKGQVKIKGTINGHPFSSSAMPHGNGEHYLVVKKEIRDAIGATQGDVVRVALEADTKPRAVSLPEDFKKILFKDRNARAAFEALAYSHQKEFVNWIESARRAETRERRIAKSLGMLLEGSTPKRSKT